MKRRTFIQSSVALAAAATVSAPDLTAAADKNDKARVTAYRPLGRTAIKMSDISFGAGKLPAASMVLRAIDRGINYFDTAPDYGPSEDLIGEALKTYRQRDKVHIASKFCHPISYTEGKSHLQVGTGKQGYVEAVENSLKRLGTDYLDVVFVHAMGEKKDLAAEKARLLDENMLEAAESLKKAGKIRYLAVSSHGPNNMETLMLEAVRSGHFDLIMPAFNFMNFPRVPELLKEAEAKGVGVIAMKTLAGARESGAKLEPGPFEQAAFKWVLSHPQVSGLVITMRSVADLNLFLPASGQKFTATDQRHLDHYAALHGSEYCRTGCGDCNAACDQGVDIATILRYQMYFENYGDEKRAMVGYAGLEKGAGACLDCADAACAGACGYGLNVAEKLRAAHRTLSFPKLA